MPRTNLPKNASPEEKLRRRVLRAQERAALRPAVIDPNQRYRLDEAAASRGQSMAALFLDIKAGKIRTERDGRRTFIRGRELIRAQPEPSLDDAKLAAANMNPADNTPPADQFPKPKRSRKQRADDQPVAT